MQPKPVTEKPRRLGRGLEALLGSAASTAQTSGPVNNESQREIDIELIKPNPYQPRREFGAEELRELESSLRTNGLLQPVTVRPSLQGFELVAGERRLRAATRLGWRTIPAVVRQLGEQEMLTLALVENLQRADLNPMEEADGFQRLIDEFSLTQQAVADAVGKERSTVANLLRLRQLPDGIRTLVRQGQLSAGHARALLALPNEAAMIDVAADIVARQLNVRDVEQLVRSRATQPPPAKPRPGTPPRIPAAEPELRRITDRLRRLLQTDVTITANAKSEGEVRIRFYSAEDFDRVVALIMGASPDSY
jgi:ParB family transcriptional regulator, chromosome partitioning protein